MLKTKHWIGRRAIITPVGRQLSLSNMKGTTLEMVINREMWKVV